MSKPKAFLKQSKSKKKVGQALDTADDYQAAGVDFEEAAGKWRAGDGAKSMRFSCRAIEVARILLEVATHPLLVPHLTRPLLEVLDQALSAHRYALQLDQDNPDTLFNAAQVLTAIAETYARDEEYAAQDALQLLEEALALQDRCLSIQELKFEEYIRQQNEAARSTGETPVEPAPAPSDDGNGDADEDGQQAANDLEDRWFSVVEPVTKDTLVDTVVAQLGTLTTLCSVLSSAESSAPSTSLAWIEEYSSKLIKAKLPQLLQDADAERLQEVALARANFVSELLKAGYAQNSIDPETYRRERDEAFRVAELGLERSFAALMANAHSLVSFNAALAEGPPSQAVSHAASGWSALSAAIANMATASKLSDPLPDDIADTHFFRGNCSLLQHQLGHPPVSYTAAVSNSKQLLKNAETFYRNASKLYQDGDQKAVAQLRAAVAQALQDSTDVIANAVHDCQAKGEEWIKNQLDDMVDDGLINPLPSVSQMSG
ncbi:hypothetical protein CLCR_04757 [Cladophialophora carrionii]|uniref:Uncharacterized protein n=1 Tax=Cladophialophora carrionii TaxID=86049 RepID=A0A1C1CK37_9EURO|nr:hypothetical protein CLCR_04757 [Cladophialophora carrionii]